MSSRVSFLFLFDGPNTQNILLNIDQISRKEILLQLCPLGRFSRKAANQNTKRAVSKEWNTYLCAVIAKESKHGLVMWPFAKQTYCYLQNKLVSVFTYVVAAVNIRSPSVSVFPSPEVNQSNKQNQIVMLVRKHRVNIPVLMAWWKS